MNSNPIPEQTQILIDLISTHYQYYYQQSIEIYSHHEVLPITFYKNFIDNLVIELCHIDFAFPITANIGYDVKPAQVSRWAIYWLLEFHQPLDTEHCFSFSLQLITANQQKSDFKLNCDNEISLYSKNNEIT